MTSSNCWFWSINSQKPEDMPLVSHWIRDVLSNLKPEGSEKKFVKVWRSFLTLFDKPSTQVYE